MRRNNEPGSFNFFFKLYKFLLNNIHNYTYIHNYTIHVYSLGTCSYNYYFIQSIEITLHVHGENLMAIKCMSMFRFILGLKMNTRFLFHHSPNPTDALSQDQLIGIFAWT